MNKLTISTKERTISFLAAEEREKERRKDFYMIGFPAEEKWVRFVGSLPLFTREGESPDKPFSPIENIMLSNHFI